MQTFDRDPANPAGSAEKLPVSALDGELFDGGDRRNVSITIAAESHSFGDEPGREICHLKRLEFNGAGELLLQCTDDAFARERPAAYHKHKGSADKNQGQQSANFDPARRHLRLQTFLSIREVDGVPLNRELLMA